MKYLRSFNESLTIYDIDWHKIAPQNLCFFKDKDKICFTRGNIMKHFDMIQITYQIKDGEKWGYPDTLEFDLYFLKTQRKKLKLDVDITYGNIVTSEFSITSPNIVDVIQYTSYHSKWDPTNTVFAFDDESLQKIIDMFNKINGFKLSVDQFKFLKHQ